MYVGQIHLAMNLALEVGQVRREIGDHRDGDE